MLYLCFDERKKWELIETDLSRLRYFKHKNTTNLGNKYFSVLFYFLYEPAYEDGFDNNKREKRIYK